MSFSLQEPGRCVSATAYGVRIPHSGIMVSIKLHLPKGAYVYTVEKVNPKIDNIQLSLSGIEMNLLTAGICFLLAISFNSISDTVLIIANYNIGLALINSLLIPDLDGWTALSALWAKNTYNIEIYIETNKGRRGTGVLCKLETKKGVHSMEMQTGIRYYFTYILCCKYYTTSTLSNTRIIYECWLFISV